MSEPTGSELYGPRQACNDCGKPSRMVITRAECDLAGGEYYNGLGICDNCASVRLENSVAGQESIVSGKEAT